MDLTPWPRLRGAASPIMYELARRAGETCYLAVLGEGGAIFLDKVDAPRSFAIATRMGGKATLHASAVEKVLLAGLSQRRLEETIAQYGFPKLTDKTITSPKELKGHLAKVREQGYAVDDEQEEGGISCVATPIYDHRARVVAALSLTGFSPRFTPERIGGLVEMVREAAARISKSLGYVVGESKP